MADLTGLWVFDYYYFNIGMKSPLLLNWFSHLSYKHLAIDPENNPTKFAWTGRDFDKYVVKRKYYERNL